MPKKAVIYDLDNTVYPVSSIGDKLFAPLFDMIEESGEHDGDIEAIKKELMRTTFRLVAARYKFSDELTARAIELQESMKYEGEVNTFEDYPEIMNIPGDRFLVTTGFEAMQRSKIKQMGIEKDFKEVHVVNPVITSKKEVFEGILSRNSYKPNEVLVVGDDPESEIQAATSLGIPTVLYDRHNEQDASLATYKIANFKELKDIFIKINKV